MKGLDEMKIIGFEESAMNDEYVILSPEFKGMRYFLMSTNSKEYAEKIAKRYNGEVFSIDDVIV